MTEFTDLNEDEEKNMDAQNHVKASQFIAMADQRVAKELAEYKTSLKNKIEKANADLKEIKFEFKTN